MKQEKGTWLNHRPNAHDGGREGEEEARLIKKIGMKERGIQAQKEREEKPDCLREGAGRG